MKDKPHHAPHHASLGWKDFVTKSWTMPREGFDLLVTDKESRLCTDKFRFDEIRACIHHRYPDKHYAWHKTAFAEQYPMYEMRIDGSGEPFANILEMRAAKIRDFLTYDSFPFVKKLIPTRYEALVKEGTASLIEEIEKLTGKKAKCTPSPPQNRPAREVDADYLKYMNTNVDWDAESLIGYRQYSKTGA